MAAGLAPTALATIGAALAGWLLKGGTIGGHFRWGAVEPLSARAYVLDHEHIILPSAVTLAGVSASTSTIECKPGASAPAVVLVDGEEEPQSVPKLRVPPLNFNRVPRKGSLRLSRGSRRSGGQRLLESYEDEADWIQVDESDHNESEDESVSSARASLLRRGRFSNGSFKRSVEVTTADESFYFTRSGAIRLDGVADKIRDCGLESTPEESVPVTDRVVVLEKLGQGAAGRTRRTTTAATAAARRAVRRRRHRRPLTTMPRATRLPSCASSGSDPHRCRRLRRRRRRR